MNITQTEEIRCSWCLSSQTYIDYHDNHWGIPIYEDQKLFECLVLESAQAGLSWITILMKIDGYRRAFHQFDVNKVANMSEEEQEELVLNPEIVRHRGKIKATVTNAQAFLKIAQEFGSFSKYFWAFSDNKVIDNRPKTLADVPVVTELAQTISKDLKKRGFKFVGPTICYAYMQAVGMANDHIEDCIARKK
ncbi:DNA-3-methyladenine glycosylase I [Marinomonas agarivorans]|nr:DNA-3-methyladenine glycosylase I [Marinomonas agarivorans]